MRPLWQLARPWLLTFLKPKKKTPQIMSTTTKDILEEVDSTFSSSNWDQTGNKYHNTLRIIGLFDLMNKRQLSTYTDLSLVFGI
jgi:hypothetical protein